VPLRVHLPTADERRVDGVIHWCDRCSPTSELTLIGPEIAALLFPGRIISSRDIFSANLEREVLRFTPALRSMSGYDHWIKGVYLITSVTSEETDKALTLTTSSAVETLLGRLDEDLTLNFQGQRLRLVNAESLSHIPDDGDLAEALRSASLPVTVVLRVTTPITCADDHIVAVNIARCVPAPVVPNKFEPLYRSACQRMASLSTVEVKHYIGGPVEEHEIATCIVTGGSRGWTIVPDLRQALLLAATRVKNKVPNQGDLLIGQRVTLTGLVARPELNGKVGMALRFLREPQRWEVQLSTGEGLKVKPVNLLESGGAARVMIFWGDARWSRAQLLGETARGHWGLCRATVGEFIVSPEEVWPGTLSPGRLAFAPISAMTDELLGRLVAEGGAARQEMEAAYQTAAGARSAAQPGEEEEEEEDEGPIARLAAQEPPGDGPFA
jgi:hypothetical protein